jgi:uncharacterized RmlC-like cupin family protein
VESKYCPELEHTIISQAGDFIFISADMPPQPVNLSETEAAQAIVARNNPNEQEIGEEFFLNE